MSKHAFLDDAHFELLRALGQKWHLSDATTLNLCLEFAPKTVAESAPSQGPATHSVKLSNGTPGEGTHYSRRLQPAVRSGGRYRAALIYTAERHEAVSEMLHRKWAAKGSLRPAEEGQPVLQVQCPTFRTGPARARFVALLEGLHDPTVLVDTPWAAFIVGAGKQLKTPLRAVPASNLALANYRGVIDSLDDYMAEWLNDPKYDIHGHGQGIHVRPRNFDQLLWWLANYPETASPHCPYHVDRRDSDEGRWTMVACAKPLPKALRRAMKRTTP